MISLSFMLIIFTYILCGEGISIYQSLYDKHICLTSENFSYAYIECALNTIIVLLAQDVFMCAFICI